VGDVRNNSYGTVTSIALDASYGRHDDSVREMMDNFISDFNEIAAYVDMENLVRRYR